MHLSASGLLETTNMDFYVMNDFFNFFQWLNPPKEVRILHDDCCNIIIRQSFKAAKICHSVFIRNFNHFNVLTFCIGFQNFLDSG